MCLADVLLQDPASWLTYIGWTNCIQIFLGGVAWIHLSAEIQNGFNGKSRWILNLAYLNHSPCLEKRQCKQLMVTVDILSLDKQSQVGLCRKDSLKGDFSSNIH